MKDMWEPVMTMIFAEAIAGVPGLLGLMKSLPHTIHAHFLTQEGYLWSSLTPSNLTIPSADLTLKYGGSVSGEWKMLYVLDALPDIGAPPDVETWSAGEASNGVLKMMHALRLQIGRPADWFGVTPLMIYRAVLPSPVAENNPSTQV